MKRFPIVLLAFLLTTIFTAGVSFAADEMVPEVEVPKVEEAVEVSTSCGSSLEMSPLVPSAVQEFATVDISSLDCNCNRNEDCKRKCGDEGTGVCHIGPICSNWPDYTGTCMCSKTGEPQEI